MEYKGFLHKTSKSSIFVILKCVCGYAVVRSFLYAGRIHCRWQAEHIRGSLNLKIGNQFIQLRLTVLVKAGFCKWRSVCDSRIVARHATVSAVSLHASGSSCWFRSLASPTIALIAYESSRSFVGKFHCLRCWFRWSIKTSQIPRPPSPYSVITKDYPLLSPLLWEHV